jgi:hypothetical protein
MDAPTAESQLAAAFDYFRMTAKHNPDAGAMHELAVGLMAAGSRLEPGAVAAKNGREASANAQCA